MTDLAEAPPDVSDIADDTRRYIAYVVSACLVALFVAMLVVFITSNSRVDDGSRSAKARAAALRKLPPYWTVRRGDSYALIARKTGLTTDELQTFNPRVDPSALLPGQRLNLRLHPPKPKPKPLGPRVVTVRPGDTFSSIGAKTGHSAVRLQQLNPKLKPATLQPGDRVRLR